LNSAIGPRLSNDGTMFIFTDQSASAGKNYAVALRKNDGSGVVRIGEGGAVAFSPDDKWALAQVSNPSQNVIYPLGPGEPKRLDHGTLELANARWLPDGKAVIVCGNEPARPVRCYTQDLEGGSPKPFSPEGVVVGAVAPDGRMAVAYTSNDQIGLWTLGETATRPVPGMTREDVVAGWSRDSQSLLVYKRAAVPARLERLDVGTGRRTLIREVAPPDRAGLIALVGISTVDDARAYAYTYWKRVSTLIVVKGAR
jgi:dipeptidyl aminopeptidase/acylaminoacyl peptidase